MKTFIILLAVLTQIVAISSAQPTLTAATSNPTTGLSYQSIYRNVFTYSNAGPAQSWDFSNFPPTAPPYTLSYVNCNSTPYCTTHPAATIASVRGGDYYYYRASSDTLLLVGAASNAGADYVYTTPEAILIYPLVYGNVSIDTFRFTMYNTSGTLLGYARCMDSTVVDGWGSLKTPAGTFQNCLRIKRVQTISTSTSYNGPFAAPTQNVIYDWYDSDHHDLLFETGVKPASNPYSFYADYTSTAVASIPWNQPSLRLSPNPSADVVNIELPDQELPYCISLVNFQGQVIYQFVSNEHTTILRLKNYPPGLYLLHVKTNNGVAYSERIVKQG